MTDYTLFNFKNYQEELNTAHQRMNDEQIIDRIWKIDHTVWKPEPTEITNRLGWLTSAERMLEAASEIKEFASEIKSEGFTDVVLLGMGGSSLAPEVFAKILGPQDGYPRLTILDSTDADAVHTLSQNIDLEKTIFIVATKSGGTVETLSFFKYFYNRVQAIKDNAGDHFIAITDPGSKLVTLAEKLNFRRIFLNDPNIGGRYSVLSYFGMVPAALLGLDIEKLLNRAIDEAKDRDAASYIGTIAGALANTGKNSLTFIMSPAMESLGDWIEQLIAESTGKEGKGILPVVGETPGQPDVYGDDRLFVYLRLDDTHDAVVKNLIDAGLPVIQIDLANRYDLGRQYFFWAMVTAVASYHLEINPFDQPNVESAKVQAQKMTSAYHESGKLPELDVTLSGDDIEVYGNISADNPAGALKAFLDSSNPGDYVVIQAYVQPTDTTTEAMQTLRMAIRDNYKLANAASYGPRFLHSTGQLHKGDNGRGLFIQITSDPQQDVAIPDEAGSDASTMTFGVLKMSQALGDRQALLDADRRFIRFHFQNDVPSGFQYLTEAV